ncbi:MAG: acetate--CoA ligase [Bacillati bacterium ANGP1]|uniref:Acetate--CoA ligase n=1 Tax=Candidatus Segetimicrobium genomatis TaxID=2569760 RepID=A0A537JJL3_9BACT|nr:MAG: acetate--CoA ligase [Terrabacteria group bacterium ANGP1]
MEVVNPVIKRWRHQAEADFEGFWARAAEAVPWFRKWDTVFESTPPTFRWFSGALTNLSHNCLDHHVGRGWGGHAALVTENERGEQRVLTYAQLLGAVEAVAAGLRRIGVRRGDRVAIYMPTCAEAIMAMLATCRIGAIHLVVFAGFGSEALAERIRLAGARTLLAADVTWRKGNEVNLWDIARRALADPATPVEKAVVLVRGRTRPALDPTRDLEWPAFLAEGPEAETRCESMEANDPAFILATSGTTAKPKLAVHNHGPYQVGIASAGKWLFALIPADVWWSTSDIGWIVGHSYIVCAPLLAGCTTIAYEGALDHPGPERFYGIAARNRVTGIFTSPTAARALMRHGTAPARRFNLRSLERVVCAGEVLNAPVWEWLQKEVLEDRVPVIDHWWQTETGGPVIGNPYGIGLLPIKPGSAGMPLPGYAAEVRALDGSPCPPREKGIVVLTRPFPGLTQTLWGDADRYARDYWRQIPGAYFTGDAAYVDEDGYFWFSGRADEIIKIADHRIGTIEVETSFLRHPAVAEAGVTGRPDPLRGEVISAFVVLKVGHQPSDALKRELLEMVRRDFGPVAVIGDLHFVGMLPKTRSGKIMRRVLKAVILNRDPGDVSTIEDEGSIEEARGAWAQMQAEVTPSGE